MALLAIGTWAIVTDAPRSNTAFYAFAWYGYLLALDAGLFVATGSSLVANRRRELAAMLFWSVPFWLLFEAYNLRLENWHYVFIMRDPRLQEVFGWISFATVLPACFMHAELAWVLGVGRRRRWRPRAVSAVTEAILAALGLACISLPWLFPRVAFPVVWGATLWLPAVINRRLGGHSLLADIERGEPRRLLGLLAGGLVAGLVWEGFNSAARCKWIYTVPGFEEFKLFEMPVAGLLGFPALAVAAFEGYALLCRLLRNGRHWERGAAVPTAPVSPAAQVSSAVLVIAVAWASHVAINRLGEQSVFSYRPVLTELAGLDETASESLAAAGVETPERLYRAALEDRGLEFLAERTQVAPQVLARAARHAELTLHKGMGSEAARLLLWADISTVRQLASADPHRLAERLRRIADHKGGTAPPSAIVHLWVRAARGSDGPRR